MYVIGFVLDGTLYSLLYCIAAAAIQGAAWRGVFSRVSQTIGINVQTGKLMLTTSFSGYSRVHISSNTAFLKILKKPSIVQE